MKTMKPQYKLLLALIFIMTIVPTVSADGSTLYPWVNLSTTDIYNWAGTSTVACLAINSSGSVYTGLDSGLFGVYNPQSNVWTNLSQTDEGNWVGIIGCRGTRLAANAVNVD